MGLPLDPRGGGPPGILLAWDPFRKGVTDFATSGIPA